MELLKLSKFKLQLHSLITEVRDLRERERSATEQLHAVNQRQKQTEEEFNRKLQELQEELTLANEVNHKLERQVSYLQNDNALLESKQRELKDTIQSLLQSREDFVSAYEESTSDMKRGIQIRDRKLSILSEKINSHISLFDSIEKEALSVKEVVDNVQCRVIQNENRHNPSTICPPYPVGSLKSKLDQVSAFEEVFIGKIHDLESKLSEHKGELQRRNKVISELEARLEAAKTNNNSQFQIEELQKILLTKDAAIQCLTSEKEALRSEVMNLRIILQRIQETVTSMNEEDKRVFSSVLDHQQDESDIVMIKEENSIKDKNQDNSRNGASGEGGSDTASPPSKEVCKPLQENNINSCVSESACSEPQSASNSFGVSVKYGKENNTTSVHLMDSECSTTQVENSQPS